MRVARDRPLETRMDRGFRNVLNRIKNKGTPIRKFGHSAQISSLWPSADAVLVLLRFPVLTLWEPYDHRGDNYCDAGAA